MNEQEVRDLLWDLSRRVTKESAFLTPNPVWSITLDDELETRLRSFVIGEEPARGEWTPE